MSLTPKVRVAGEAGSYQDYTQDHVYAHDRGLVVLPVAGRTSKHRLIRLHGGYAMRTVRWNASRAGAPPIIPVAADTNGDTLISDTVAPSLPRVNVQAGGYDWTVSGEYVYVQNTPRETGVNAFPAGEHPYVVLPQAGKLADLLPPSLTSTVYAGNRDDAQSEYLTQNLSQYYDPQNASHVVWPMTVLPAAYSSTHIIGG